MGPRRKVNTKITNVGLSSHTHTVLNDCLKTVNLTPRRYWASRDSWACAQTFLQKTLEVEIDFCFLELPVKIRPLRFVHLRHQHR